MISDSYFLAVHFDWIPARALPHVIRRFSALFLALLFKEAGKVSRAVVLAVKARTGLRGILIVRSG